jgi:hypothetical protein
MASARCPSPTPTQCRAAGQVAFPGSLRHQETNADILYGGLLIRGFEVQVLIYGELPDASFAAQVMDELILPLTTAPASPTRPTTSGTPTSPSCRQIRTAQPGCAAWTHRPRSCTRSSSGPGRLLVRGHHQCAQDGAGQVPVREREQPGAISARPGYPDRGRQERTG